MANPSPGSSPPNDERGSHQIFTRVGRQFSNKLYTEYKQQKRFWSIFARQAKCVLVEDDSNACLADNGQRKNQLSEEKQARPPTESMHQHADASLLQRRLEAIRSSLSSLGGSISNVIEESVSKVEAKATDLMSSRRATESAKAIHLKEQDRSLCQEKPSTLSTSSPDKEFSLKSLQQQPFIESTNHVYDSVNILKQSSHEQADSVYRPSQHRYSITRSTSKEDSLLRTPGHLKADKETQLKASRDVAMAMAAKAKLLLDELKEAKADLAVAKERYTKLEEENQMIRASINIVLKPDEEDLVRVQLETLLAEKAQLAQENAYFVRENQFLHEMIEFHRMTMTSGGSILEDSMLDVSKKSLGHQFQEDIEVPQETNISTITN